MTTELEKQFFQCFGIKPKKTITCVIEEDWLNDYHLKIWYPISDWMKNNAPCKGEKECSNKCNCYQVKNTYPQITDNILLKLICYITVQQYQLVISNKRTIDDLKKYILKKCIKDYSKNEYLKHQVQAIFKGER